MTQLFEEKSGKIISATVKPVTSDDGVVVDKVVIRVAGDTRPVWIPFDAFKGALDRMIPVKSLIKFKKAKLYYVASIVKEGDTFSFTEGGEELVAESDLYITNVTGVIGKRKFETYLEELPIYVPKATEKVNAPMDYTALIEEVNALSNVANARALVQAHDVFDDHAEAFDELSTADTYKVAMLEIINAIEE